MVRILATVAILLVAGSSAVAQKSLPDTEAGQFILRRVDDGFMRLDRDTGAVSFCRKRNRAWVCVSIADDRVALEEEIERLSRENSELAVEIGRLRDRIARLEGGDDQAGAGAPPTPGDPNTDTDQNALNLPSDEEIDKVMKTFESMMRRFLDMVRDLRDEYDQGRT